jgi:catechol 2,3-dioxygenase-like lactoylglutathione lyase family enzyme
MRLSHWFVMFAALFLVPAPVPSPSLAGIAHVAFRVTDLSRSREFYQTLGFVEAFEFSDPGKPPVSYMKINDRQFIELYGGVDDAHPPGLMHICYEVRDIQSLVQDYATRGLDPPAARKARAGNMLLLLHDTEGRMVEFTEYLPGSLHFEDRGKHLGKQPIARHLVEAGFSVDNLLVESAFYKGKLAFTEVARSDQAVTLRLPGDSMERIKLVASKPESKSRMVFETPDISRAYEELYRTGLAVKPSEVSLEISDPDGTVIIFLAAPEHSDDGH